MWEDGVMSLRRNGIWHTMDWDFPMALDAAVDVTVSHTVYYIMAVHAVQAAPDGQMVVVQDVGWFFLP